MAVAALLSGVQPVDGSPFQALNAAAGSAANAVRSVRPPQERNNVAPDILEILIRACYESGDGAEAMADPDTITKLLTESLTEVGLTPEDIARVLPCLNGSRAPPRLLFLLAHAKPTSHFFQFRQKMEQVAERFTGSGLTFELYRKAAVEYPSLLYLAADTVIGNITGLVEKLGHLGLSEKQYIRAAVLQPSLFGRSPDTISANITDTAEALNQFGLTAENYLKAALKQPSIFTCSPSTTAARVMRTVEGLRHLGLTERAYVKAASRNPTLFFRSPEAVRGRIAELAAKLGHLGLTERDYVRAAMRQPTLFVLLPETVERNFSQGASRFRHLGVTEREYLKAALKQPSLFSQLPRTIAGNICGTVARLSDRGLTEQDYVRAAVRHPPLFAQAPATIARHASMIFRMQAQGTIGADHDLMAYLLRNGRAVSFADSNIRLRRVFALAAGLKDMTPAAIFHPPREKVEREVVRLYGFDPDAKALPALGSIPYRGTQEQRRHRALLTMARTGILQGYKASEPCSP